MGLCVRQSFCDCVFVHVCVLFICFEVCVIHSSLFFISIINHTHTLAQIKSKCLLHWIGGFSPGENDGDEHVLYFLLNLQTVKTNLCQTASLMKQISSLLELVIIHVGPVARAFWGYFLVYNISEEWDLPERGRPESMFYSSSLSLVVACFGFCLMFLLKTSICVCVRSCLVAILLCLSPFPALLYSFVLSALILMCLCV